MQKIVLSSSTFKLVSLRISKIEFHRLISAATCVQNIATFLGSVHTIITKLKTIVERAFLPGGFELLLPFVIRYCVFNTMILRYFVLRNSVVQCDFLSHLSCLTLKKKSTILTTAGDGTWILSTDRGRTLFARWHNTTPSMSAQDKSCGSSTFNLCSMMDLSCWMQSDSSLARVACCLPLLLANFVLEVATMIGSSDLFVDGAVMISKSIKLILHSTHKKLMKIHLQDLVFSNIELDPSVVQTGGLVGLRSLSDEELVRCYK